MPELLACPDCAGTLRSEGNLLRCGCATWPILAEIPILTPWSKNRTLTLEQVLARHLPPAPHLVGRIIRRILPGTAAIERAISDRDATFMDLAAALGRTRDLDYFRYRFSDLSYITTAALCTPLTKGPVLDLGCGAGHMIRALFKRLPRTLLVGIDLNFALLYLAKRFVAPEALFLCADASARLPLRDGCIESSLSADTFRYLPDWRRAAQELQRVTRGPIVLAHLSDPHSQDRTLFTPPDPVACVEMFSGRGPILHGERKILAAFLKRRELDLSPSASPAEGAVSLTSGIEPRVYPDADYFVSGSSLNPIYEICEDGNDLQLSRRAISERYSEIYKEYDDQLPERLRVTREQITSRDPELVRKFILLDLPPNYC